MSRRKRLERTRPPAAGVPLRLAADGAVLLLVLTGLLFSVTSAYGLEVSGRGLLGTALVLTALVLLLYELPRRRWVVAVAYGLVYVYLGWHYQDALVAGACLAADRVLQALDIALRVDSVWMTGGPAELLWFLSMAAALVCLPLGWAVIRGRSAALTAALTAPWLVPALVVERMPAWLPLMTLVAGWCVLLLAGFSGREDGAGGARYILVCLPVTVALLALLTALLPRSGYVQPDWTASVRGTLQDTALGFVGSGGPLGAVASLVSGGDQVSVRLDDAGPRDFQGRVVLEVESDYAGRVYLRGTSSAVYTGAAWEALSDEVYAEIGLTEGAAVDSLNGYEPLNFPAMTTSGQPYYEMTITYPASLAGWMYTPYQLTTTPAEISDVTFVHDSHLERRLGVREKNLFFNPEALPNPWLTGQQTWDAAEAEANYRAFVYEHYLDVPAGLEETLQQWYDYVDSLVDYEDLDLVGVPGPSGPYHYALQMTQLAAEMLRVSTAYDLGADYTPEEADFVDYFLNESRTGYCVHYATAGVLILRAWGIPARYVAGYTVEIPESGSARVLDSDAHAWVEIYLDGYGWYPMEMTPSAGTGIPNQFPMVQADEAAEEEPAQETPETSDTPAETPDEPAPEPETPAEPEPDAAAPEAEAGSSPGPAWFLWAALALLVAAVPVRAAWKRNRARRRLEDRDANRAVIAAYNRLEALRPWGADPDGAVGRLAEKAKFSQHRLDDGERQDALAAAAAEEARVKDGLPRWKRWLLRWVLGL